MVDTMWYSTEGIPIGDGFGIKIDGNDYTCCTNMTCVYFKMSHVELEKIHITYEKLQEVKKIYKIFLILLQQRD